MAVDEIYLTGGGQGYRYFTVQCDRDPHGRVVEVSFSSAWAEAPDAPYHPAVVLGIDVVQTGGSSAWLVQGQLLLGPDGISLVPADYHVFGRVVDTPERDAQSMGYLRVR